jgi:hypothetical protein
VVFLTVPLLAVIWSLVWKLFPETPPNVEAMRPAWFTPLARFLDWLQFGMGILAALVMVSLGRGLRRFRRPELITRALGILVWIQVLVIIGISAALASGGAATLTGFGNYLPGFVATFMSYAIAGSLLYSATRCLITTRGTPLPALSWRSSKQSNGLL